MWGMHAKNYIFQTEEFHFFIKLIKQTKTDDSITIFNLLFIIKVYQGRYKKSQANARSIPYILQHVILYLGYPAKRALSAMRKHGR